MGCFLPGELEEFFIAGVGQIVKVCGRSGCGYGETFGDEQFGHIGRAVIGMVWAAIFAVVRFEPGAWEAVFRVADERIGGGDERSSLEPIAGIAGFEGGPDDTFAEAVDESGGLGHGIAPLQLSVADAGVGADAVNAESGHGRLISFGMFEIMEEAVTFVT